eukprot:g2.t1
MGTSHEDNELGSNRVLASVQTRGGSLAMKGATRRQSADFRFDAHLKREFRRARMKKICQATMARELIDMSRAEAEQCENGRDKFWGVDAATEAIARAAFCGMTASTDAKKCESCVEKTVRTILLWVRREAEHRRKRKLDEELKSRNVYDAHMRSFWKEGSTFLEGTFSLNGESPATKQAFAQEEDDKEEEARGDEERQKFDIAHCSSSEGVESAKAKGHARSDATRAIFKMDKREDIPLAVSSKLKAALLCDEHAGEQRLWAE